MRLGSYVFRITDANSVYDVPDIRVRTVLGKEVAGVGDWVPELANRAVLGFEDIPALNDIPDVFVVDRLEPVAHASALLIVPVLGAFVSVWARTDGDALARARADIPVAVNATIFSVRNALAAASSNVPVVIDRAGLDSTIATASVWIPIVILITLLR